MIAKIKNYKILLNNLVSVNIDDVFLGSIEKQQAHLNSYIIKNNSSPHRAFSLFLFNSDNQLLLQKRSEFKKTFPLCWTNTCCSHPNMVQLEGSKQLAIQHTRQAIHRALDRELKMDLSQQKFYFIDKILYKAEARVNEELGQYEVDYIYLCKINKKTIPFTKVQSQICETKWVNKTQLNSFIQQKLKENEQLSPWFMIMLKNRLLDKWWEMVIKNQLKNIGEQQNYKVNIL